MRIYNSLHSNGAKYFLFVVAVFLSTLLSGCDANPNRQRVVRPSTSAPDIDIAKRSYLATEVLLDRSKQPLDKNKPILVASIVDVNDLEKSSSLGRILAEQISGRIVQLGYYVGEPKLRDSLAMKQETGELILSRDLKYLTKTYNAQAVVSGTYAAAGDKVYINLKLILANTGRVLSAVDYSLPLNRDTKALVKN